MVYNWLTRTLNSVMPQQCLGCGAASPEHRLCSGCFRDLPWLGAACTVCGIPLGGIELDAASAGGHSICGECLTTPPHVDHCITPLRYEFPLPSLLARFKQQRRQAYGAALADILGRHLLQHLQQAGPASARPQCIVPVPLHPWTLRRRGFNQAQLLATEVGRRLDIPVTPALLKRIKRAPAQHTLSARERQRNLLSAFAVAGDCSQLTHVAVLDDVVTTMTTANTLAQLLKQQGVQRVDIWAVARTPRLLNG